MVSSSKPRARERLPTTSNIAAATTLMMPLKHLHEDARQQLPELHSTIMCSTLRRKPVNEAALSTTTMDALHPAAAILHRMASAAAAGSGMQQRHAGSVRRRGCRPSASQDRRQPAPPQGGGGHKKLLAAHTSLEPFRPGFLLGTWATTPAGRTNCTEVYPKRTRFGTFRHTSVPGPVRYSSTRFSAAPRESGEAGCHVA